MAISHVHPMFLLILSLFFLPTLLAEYTNTFDNCWVNYGGIRVTSGKEFIEEGRKSFDLTFFTGTVVTEGVILLVVKQGYYIPEPILNEQRYNLCDLITCPVTPGSFVITFRKLYPVGIKSNIHTSIVINAGPDEIINGEAVPAEGSMCANIRDWYIP